MTIVRVATRPRYTVVDNRPIEDPRLSFGALGLLTFLLSKPDHWEVSYRHLATVKTGLRGEKEHAVRMMLGELRSAGYLVQTKERVEGGRWEWVSVVYEVPQGPADPPVAPCGDSRGVDHRGVDDRGREDRGEVTTEGATPDVASTEAQPDASPSSKDGEPEDRDPGKPDTTYARATVATAASGLATARAVLRMEMPAPDVDVTVEERALVEQLSL